MIRTPSRSLLSLAAVLLFPVLASAQATHVTTPTTAPAAKPAVAAHAATPPAGKSAAATATAPAHVMTTAAPTTAKAAVAAPTTAASATPAPAKPANAAAGPARDARGRFIAKSATPAAGNHATCKDGSAWTGAQRSGACARHGGVKAWN